MVTYKLGQRSASTSSKNPRCDLRLRSEPMIDGALGHSSLRGIAQYFGSALAVISTPRTRLFPQRG